MNLKEHSSDPEVRAYSAKCLLGQAIEEFEKLKKEHPDSFKAYRDVYLWAYEKLHGFYEDVKGE